MSKITGTDLVYVFMKYLGDRRENRAVTFTDDTSQGSSILKEVNPDPGKD